MSRTTDTPNRVAMQIRLSATPTRLLSVAVALFTLLLSSNPARAQNPTDSESDGTRRLKGIHSLGLNELPGTMPAYYSPSARKRAKELQALLGGETQYYAELFHVQFAPVTLAVLTPDHWPKIVDEPYGMPSISDSPPYVFVMPESWEGVTWMPFPKREDTDPDLVARALVAGRTWNRVRLECGDGIGTHEIGHSIVRQLGIAPQVLWLDELLASYVGYAYLAAKDPMRALSTDIFATDGLKHSAHPFTRLEDFESNYTTLSQKYPANYVWYQFSFDQRVRQTFRQRGVDFLRQLQVTLPTGGPKLDTTQVLAKLETINPGWEAWAARVNSGEISRSR